MLEHDLWKLCGLQDEITHLNESEDRSSEILDAIRSKQDERRLLIYRITYSFNELERIVQYTQDELEKLIASAEAAGI